MRRKTKVKVVVVKSFIGVLDWFLAGLLFAVWSLATFVTIMFVVGREFLTKKVSVFSSGVSLLSIVVVLAVVMCVTTWLLIKAYTVWRNK